MILYDLNVKGYHTPLTREQIAELFHAGRVDRHHPCKLTVKSEWRTIDELFPLRDCANAKALFFLRFFLAPAFVRLLKKPLYNFRMRFVRVRELRKSIREPVEQYANEHLEDRFILRPLTIVFPNSKC